MRKTLHIEPADYASIVLRLFQGPLYSDDSRNWSQLELYQQDIRDYLGKIGIDVVINEDEGFAYLTQNVEELDELKLPRVVQRRALSYEVTLLCVILYQKLLEFDAKDIDSSRLFLTRSQILDEIELLFPETNNRSRLLDKIDIYIRSVVDLGYLTKVRRTHQRPDEEERYEVRRILKARLSVDTLQGILNSLQPEKDVHPAEPNPNQS